MNERGTVLAAVGEDRRALIRIVGQNDRTNHLGKAGEIKDDYVPVGATGFRLKDTSGLKPGDTVEVVRPCTQAWIERLGMRSLAAPGRLAARLETRQPRIALGPGS